MKKNKVLLEYIMSERVREQNEVVRGEKTIEQKIEEMRDRAIPRELMISSKKKKERDAVEQAEEIVF